MVWLPVGDFVAALVFLWVYDRVWSSFGGGVGNGVKFGLYAGVLVNSPTWLFGTALFNGFPYEPGWIRVANGIVFGVVGGAVAGVV